MELPPDKDSIVLCEGKPICIYPLVGIFQILVDTGDNKRLITLLGESHNTLDIDPPYNAVSVQKYVSNVLKSNKHAKIGIEVGKGDTEQKVYSSPNIDNILELRNEGYSEKIIGLDIRRLLLYHDQEVLYQQKLFEGSNPIWVERVKNIILTTPDGGMYSIENLVSFAINF